MAILSTSSSVQRSGVLEYLSDSDDSENDSDYEYTPDFGHEAIFRESHLENISTNPDSNCNTTEKVVKAMGQLSLDQTENVVIAHYRGLHFYREHFDKEKRQSARRFHQLQNKGVLHRTGLFSAAVHEKAEVDLDFPLVNRDYSNVEVVKKEILRRENSLYGCKQIIMKKMYELQNEQKVEAVLYRSGNPSKTKYDSRFDEFIQRYVNSYKTLSEDIKEAKDKKIDNRSSQRTRTKWTILKNLGFTKLPVVSTSEESKWSLEYATGFVNWDKEQHLLRNGSSITPLTPEYSRDGHSKHPYLGVVYITLHSPNQLPPQDSARIVEMFAQEKIITVGGIGGHDRSGYVRARERAFLTGIDEKHVRLARIIRVPNFRKGYRPFCDLKYGLTKLTYENFKEQLGRRNLMETTQRIIEHIISYQTGALAETAKHIAQTTGLKLMYVGEVSGIFTETIPDLKTFTAKKKAVDVKN